MKGSEKSVNIPSMVNNLKQIYFAIQTIMTIRKSETISGLSTFIHLKFLKKKSLLRASKPSLYRSSWVWNAVRHVVFYKAIATIIFIIFWDFLMFHQIFLSPQVKRCAIITYKHGIYELPHELPNDLRLRILGN